MTRYTDDSDTAVPIETVRDRDGAAAIALALRSASCALYFRALICKCEVRIAMVVRGRYRPGATPWDPGFEAPLIFSI